MRDVTAESGVISKEMEDFSVSEIIDTDYEKDGPEKTALWYYILNRERRVKGSLESPHVDYRRGGSQESKSGVGLGFHRQTV